MPRTERTQPNANPEAPRTCPCGALIDGRGDLCRKCRGRLRWLRRLNGKRRDQWRAFNQSSFFVSEVVNAS
ncbi:hypothetical protein K7472_27275 [Streptomyces sp. PTM05]|uniref:DUF1289 domain-containing protein n=1 Tax=Streptantibioticus parmotrematis TaxID=2873249 RepID=A0ABS7QZ73_9ACTN|nr:hypothetical protein [Streptantibioticus parmotrematis]MBY8888515.1 hypothetical protein [Streptantibioticus parmotrematis]